MVCVINIFAFTGCVDRSWAPQLTRPARPELTPIAREDWRRTPSRVRVIVTDNQEKIFQYVDSLELVITRYQEWRSGK